MAPPRPDLRVEALAAYHDRDAFSCGIDSLDRYLRSQAGQDVRNQTLTIKCEKSEEKEDNRKDYFLSERRYGSFQRSFQLPESVDADKIDAQFAKGVLTVTLPKTAGAKKAEKNIEVKKA